MWAKGRGSRRYDNSKSMSLLVRPSASLPLSHFNVHKRSNNLASGTSSPARSPKLPQILTSLDKNER